MDAFSAHKGKGNPFNPKYIQTIWGVGYQLKKVNNEL